MKEITLSELVQKASADTKEWHFHYLTQDCIFNDSGQHKVVLEQKEETYYALVEEKPTNELNQLFTLFNKRK